MSSTHGTSSIPCVSRRGPGNTCCVIASVLLALAAPLLLVLVALGLAALRLHAGPCAPHARCAWAFLDGRRLR